MKKCSRCKIEKPLSDFSKDKQHKTGYKSACKVCASSDFKVWKEANSDKCKEIWRRSHYKTTYDLPEELIEQLLKDRVGICSICGSSSALVVDHCHTTGKVRGLICSSCNSLLGYSKDNVNTLENAIQYLKDFYGN